MPIFEDINYEIQDQAMFNAAKECRIYLEKHLHSKANDLYSKIWREGQKWEVPYHRYTGGNKTLYHHVHDIRDLLRGNYKRQADKKIAAQPQESIETQGHQTSIPNIEREECTSTAINSVIQCLEDDGFNKALLARLSFAEVASVIVRVPEAYVPFEAEIRDAIATSCADIPVDVVVEFLCK